MRMAIYIGVVQAGFEGTYDPDRMTSSLENTDSERV